MWRQAHYRAAVDTAIDAIIIIDGRGIIQSTNAAVKATFGYDPKELEGRNITALMPCGDACRHDQYLDSYRTTRERKVIGVGRSVSARRKDGSLFPAELSVAEWTDPSGHVYFTGILRDVTESRAATNALRESQEWLRIVSDTADAGLIVVDRERRIRFANRAFVDLLGLAPGDLAGCRVADVFPHERDLRDRLEAAFDGARSTADVVRPVADGKQSRHLKVTCELSRDGSGHPAAVVVVTDVTELKTSESRLRASRDLLQSVLDGTSDAIFAKDLDGRYVAMNEAGARLAGRPREEIIGATDRCLLSHEFGGQVMSEDTHIVCSGRADVIERDLVVDGELRHLVITKRPWTKPDGTARGVVGIAHDVTEQRHAARERTELSKRLMRAQELERLRIARDLHDEVGQDLTALSLQLKILEREIGGDTARDRLACLRDLTDQISRSIHRTALELRPTSLEDLGLCMAITSHVADFTARSGVQIDLHLEALDSFLLESDARLALYRGVQESLTNVLKHADATSVSIVAQPHKAKCRLIVEDNGRGFETDVCRRMTREGGLGLVGIGERLALCGGTLNVESAPGHGTSVFMTVPARTNGD